MGRFETTRWSVVLRARGDPADSRAALETLCRTYRPPVLAFVRSRGYPLDVAEDLTQTFFARFLERAWHASADPERGRFRAFLLTAVKRFLGDAGDKATALKRGGGFRFQSLDEASADIGSGVATPDQVFQHEWAKVVLETVLARLREEARSSGKLELFECLAEFLVERPDAADYERVAAQLGLRRNTLAVAVHRLRHRLRELVQAELSETTTDRADLDRELRELRETLGGEGS